MNRAWFAVVACMVFLVCLGACSSGGSSAAGGGAGGFATGGAAGMATGGAGVVGTGGTAGAIGSGGAGGQTLCDAACATFVGCGVTIKSTCSADCQAASSSYKTCLQNAGSDCSQLALCYLQAVAPTDCPAGGGVPSGSADGGATCATTETCNGTCNDNSSGSGCNCGCATALKSNLAIWLLDNNSCAADKCPTECGGPSGPGPSCNTCFEQKCASQRSSCLAH